VGVAPLIIVAVVVAYIATLMLSARGAPNELRSARNAPSGP